MYIIINLYKNIFYYFSYLKFIITNKKLIIKWQEEIKDKLTGKEHRKEINKKVMTIKKDRSLNMSKINKSIFTYYS
jgi:hypothetical protein